MKTTSKPKTLIEGWTAEADSCSQFHDTSGGVYRECIRDLTDACTPRPPRAEWFGTGPAKWDAWWCEVERIGPMVIRGCVLVRQFDILWIRGAERLQHFGSVKKCLPIAREGAPVPVGWSVVEPEVSGA